MNAFTADWPVTNWCVIACQSRREAETARWLRHFGSTIFMPMRKVEIKNTRAVTASRRHRGAFKTVLRPIFPGYFFGHSLRGPLGDLREVPGLHCVLRSRRIDEAVATLQEAAADTGLIEVPESAKEDQISIGDVIQVIDGPFTFFGGVVVDVPPPRIDDADRIRADIEIFGRLTPVELYIDQIKVVAQARHPECSARPEGTVSRIEAAQA